MFVRIYVFIYIYVGYVCICIYVCVCVFVRLSHEQIATAYTFWSSQFHSQSQLSVFPCLSRNTKKTIEVWIYAGITVRRWLSDVTVMLFQFCDNIKYKVRYRKSLTLFW